MINGVLWSVGLSLMLVATSGSVQAITPKKKVPELNPGSLASAVTLVGASTAIIAGRFAQRRLSR